LNIIFKIDLIFLIIIKLFLFTIGKGFASMAGEYNFFKFKLFNIIYSEIKIITGNGEIYIYLEKENIPIKRFSHYILWGKQYISITSRAKKQKI